MSMDTAVSPVMAQNEPQSEMTQSEPQSQAPTTPAAMVLAPAFATTPKRGAARKVPKEPATLLAYAIEQGGRINLTPDTVRELAARGLSSHRIPNAAYGIRKFFAKNVKGERTGRTISAYVVSL